MAWTKDEDKYLIDNIKTMPVSEIAKILGKKESIVYQRTYKLNCSKTDTRWTDEKVKILRRMYYTKSIGAIARKLNMSEDAIKSKAKRLRLTDRVETYSTGDIANLFQVKNIKSIHYWHRMGYLEYKVKGKGKNKKRYSSVNQIKKFMYNHQDKWCSIKGYMALDFYERCPKWLKCKIEKDKETNGLRLNQHWTNEEDEMLSKIYPDTNYEIKDIASLLGRTERSICLRASTLFLKRDRYC